MNTRLKESVRSSENGIALLVAIFTLLLLTAIGAGMIMLTNTDTNISSNFRDEQTAFFSAKAGVEEIRDRLRPSGPTAADSLSSASNVAAVTAFFNAQALPGSTNGVLYVTNPANGETDTPWNTTGAAYPDDEICSEMAYMGVTYACGGNPPHPAGSPWYTTTSASTTYQATPVLPWKWVRITAKTNLTSSGTTSASTVDGLVTDTNQRVCWNGTTEVTIANTYANCAAYPATPPYQPVYVMTALAVTPSGSRRMVQAEASATTFPTLPGPLIFDGPTPSFSPPNSNAMNVDGTDHSATGNANGPQSFTCPAPVNQPAIGTTSATDATNVAASIPKPGDFTSGTTPTPAVSNVYNELGPLQTVQGLENLVNQVTAAASSANIVNGNASGITNPGTPASPVINVVTGNLSIGGGFSGAGILLVEGTLTMSGNPSFDGLILVVGQGQFIKNGGGNGTLDGSVLVANLYNSSGQLLPGNGPPGIPNITWNGGGNAQFNYDSCWSQALSKSLSYRIVAVREMMK